MPVTAALMMALLVLLLSPLGGQAQDSRTALDGIAKAMGATTLKSIDYTGTGSSFAVGQSTAPGQPWPRST